MQMISGPTTRLEIYGQFICLKRTLKINDFNSFISKDSRSVVPTVLELRYLKDYIVPGMTQITAYMVI